MTPAKRLFDEKQEKQIIDAYMAGETVQRLAKIWGSEKAIRNILKRAGIKKTDRQKKKKWKVDEALHPQIEQEYREGGFTHVIAEKYGVSARTIKSILVARAVSIRTSGESKERISIQERQKVKEMYIQGMKQAHIAAELEVSEGVIHRVLNLLEVERRDAWKLSKEQQEEIVERYLSGKDDTQTLGKEFGVAPLAIKRTVIRHGHEIRSRGEGLVLAWERGLDIADICRRYEAGESSVQIGEDYERSSGTIINILRRHGISIRKSEGGGDTIEHAINGTLNFQFKRDSYYYVYTVKGYPNLLKPGIAFDMERRSSLSDGKGVYGDRLLEILYPTREEAFFLEQAILNETSDKWEAPDELIKIDWGGISELREMEFDELEEVIIYYQNKLLEMEPWLFAAEYVPMTDVQREECLQKAWST